MLQRVCQIAKKRLNPPTHLSDSELRGLFLTICSPKTNNPLTMSSSRIDWSSGKQASIFILQTTTSMTFQAILNKCNHVSLQMQSDVTLYTKLVNFKKTPTLNIPCVKPSLLTGGERKLATPSVTEVAHTVCSPPQASSRVSSEKAVELELGISNWEEIEK